MLWVSTSEFIPSLWCWVRCAVSGTIPEARIQFLPFRLCVSALTKKADLQGTEHATKGIPRHSRCSRAAVSTHGITSFTESSSQKCADEWPTEAALFPMPRPWDPQPAAWARFATKLGNLSYLGILWSSVISGWFIIRSKVRFSRLHICPYGNFLSVS